MRLMILPLMLVIAGQAHAQDRAPRTMSADQVADTLSNPVVQAGIAGLASAFADTLLDTRIGALAPYARDVHPRDTLGDVVRREDPRFDERLRNNTRRAVGIAGQVTRDGATMATELGKTVDRLRVLLDGTIAIANGDSRDDY